MSSTPSEHTTRPTLAIGACLAGQPVRYNAQTKAANGHVKALMDAFEMRSFCPEMGIGMGTPREPIHLVGTAADQVRAVDVATHNEDYTAPLAAYAEQVLERAPELCGYILVKGSPSCGYDRVKRYADNGHSIASDTQGVFAAALHRADPLLPLEDDGRLNDPGLRESFVTRAYTYHEWKQLRREGISPRAIVDFYSRYKYLVMAHHVPSYKSLGRLVAEAGKRDIDALADEFIELLMAALSERATQRSHSNVLFHLSGYLKRQLSDAERQRLKTLIDQYRVGDVPLIVPVTMLKHHFANNPNQYIEQQAFMQPYPDELRLRNLL